MPDYIVNQHDAEDRPLSTGLAFPPGKRLQPGDTVKSNQLPKGSIRGLLRRGVISPVEEED